MKRNTGDGLMVTTVPESILSTFKVLNNNNNSLDRLNNLYQNSRKRKMCRRETSHNTTHATLYVKCGGSTVYV